MEKKQPKWDKPKRKAKPITGEHLKMVLNGYLGMVRGTTPSETLLKMTIEQVLALPGLHTLYSMGRVSEDDLDRIMGLSKQVKAAMDECIDATEKPPELSVVPRKAA